MHVYTQIDAGTMANCWQVAGRVKRILKLPGNGPQYSRHIKETFNPSAEGTIAAAIASAALSALFYAQVSC